MSEPISNRYDFVILFDVENGNPNGDPDAGNMPRVDPETGFGLVTDVCLKRKIRNYVETVKEDSEGYRIYIKDQVPLQRSDAEALTYLGVDKDLKSAKKDDPLLDGKIRDFMCRNFYDIRTFGAVMTTFVKGALNCGQVRGPVQIGFARSVEPILPQEITITRVAITTESDAANKDTEMGRKYIVPYGLYRAEGFVSANLARKVTGFSQEDLQLLWDAILNMFENDHSAARGKWLSGSLLFFNMRASWEMPLLISCLMLSMWIGLRGRPFRENTAIIRLRWTKICPQGLSARGCHKWIWRNIFPYQGSSIFVSVRGSGR